MRHRKNLRVALATSVTLVAGTLATVAVTASPAQAVPNVTINLVGINDFHGRIDANTVKWAGTVEQLKASDSPTRWSSAPATSSAPRRSPRPWPTTSRRST